MINDNCSLTNQHHRSRLRIALAPLQTKVQLRVFLHTIYQITWLNGLSKQQSLLRNDDQVEMNYGQCLLKIEKHN